MISSSTPSAASWPWPSTAPASAGPAADHGRTPWPATSNPRRANPPSRAGPSPRNCQWRRGSSVRRLTKRAQARQAASKPPDNRPLHHRLAPPRGCGGMPAGYRSADTEVRATPASGERSSPGQPFKTIPWRRKTIGAAPASLVLERMATRSKDARRAPSPQTGAIPPGVRRAGYLVPPPARGSGRSGPARYPMAGCDASSTAGAVWEATLGRKPEINPEWSLGLLSGFSHLRAGGCAPGARAMRPRPVATVP